MAGAGFQISKRVVLDLGYRFIDLGKAESGRGDTSGFANNPPLQINDLTAHEFKVGLRFHFGGGASRFIGNGRPGPVPGLVFVQAKRAWTPATQHHFLYFSFWVGQGRWCDVPHPASSDEPKKDRL